MKRFVFALILLVVSFCTLGFAQEKSPILSPEDSQGQFLWDFGKVKEGEVLRHEFILKNSRPLTLKIANLQPSCSCLSAKIKNKELPPQGSTVLTISFDTKGEFGPVQQFVYLQTDNLDNPVLRYIIKARVEK